MKDLVREIATDFEYSGVIQGEYDSIMIKGEYTFESTFMGSDLDIVVNYEDGDCTDISICFTSDVRFIPDGAYELLSKMLKMFVKEGFISWKEEYNENN